MKIHKVYVLVIQKLTSTTYGYYGLFGTQQVNLEYGSTFRTMKKVMYGM